MAAGNAAPLTFQVLRGVFSAQQLASAFTQVSGEVGTAVAPTGIQAMNSFLTLAFDSAVDDERGVPITEAKPIPAPNGLRGTVHSLGYAGDDRVISSGPFGMLQSGSFVGQPARNPWSVWGAGFGGQASANGNAFVVSHDRSSDTYGAALGADYRVTPDTKLGFALAGGRNGFGVADGLGTGRSDMIQAAVYARTYFGSAYITTAIAYAWHSVVTNRDLTFAGNNVLNASFSAQDVAGQIEAGYRIGWFIPYVAVGVQAFHTPGYTEHDPTGPSVFALSEASNTTVTARTQVGFRIDEDVGVYDGGVLRLRTRAAWAHDTNTNPYINVTLQSLPGANFSVYGASRASDSFLFSAGPELLFGNGISLALAAEGQVARGYDAYSGNAVLRYVW
ncbi:autotransporter outer membrane beta-barrel domain-containing protein [Lichenihabitans sp. PAMC28606]|uniref:autotransporter outer membrane beta-barrel domain-containing protein n=1 Tax=Lichenihabitans sp. PAMC28606 TaxID=2880932 RepID=UPI001D0B457A|nr:autotransporter outer membrane beta-barrel domain-containing protein [Lichenihabitans sp. PAMC28606]UDL93246.1 autotransporter outer membrane beta-barrel domain-containing protein [Lichenihabitans sp. PAMC28606]